MQEVTAWVRETGVLDMEAIRFDEYDILRFCRARKFEVGKIRTMLENFAEWRTAENIDTLYETW